MATSYQDDFIKTALRLPRDLHARLMESSREKGRSFNAELIHVISAHFDNLDNQVAQLGAALEAERQQNISLGLKDPADRTAVLKVLLLEELMLLKNRVANLGGRDAVLSAQKADLVKQLEGPKIKGTDEERKSYFSTIVEQTPLTAILTTEELNHIAGRVAAMQRAHEAAGLLASKPPKKPSDH